MASICAETMVADYAKWRAVFDSNAQGRAALGFTNPRVFRNADNGNHVIAIVDTDDPVKARQALESPEYRARMQQGGIIGTPKIYIIG